MFSSKIRLNRYEILRHFTIILYIYDKICQHQKLNFQTNDRYLKCPVFRGRLGG